MPARRRYRSKKRSVRRYRPGRSRRMMKRQQTRMLGCPIRVHKHKLVMAEEILAGDEWAGGQGEATRLIRLQNYQLGTEAGDDRIMAFNYANRWGVIHPDYEEYKVTGVAVKYYPNQFSSIYLTDATNGAPIGIDRHHQCLDFDGEFDTFPPDIRATQQAGYKIRAVNRPFRQYIDLRKYSASKALGWQTTVGSGAGPAEQNTLGPAQLVWQLRGRNLALGSPLCRIEVTWYVTTRGTTYRNEISDLRLRPSITANEEPVEPTGQIKT